MTKRNPFVTGDHMAKTLCIILMLLTPALAKAEQNDRTWTKTDTAFEVAFLATVALDLYTTSHALKQKYDTGAYVYSEANPLLGRRPSDLRLGLSCLGVGVAHALLMRALPAPYRRAAQSLSIGIEAVVVSGNIVRGGGISGTF